MEMPVVSVTGHFRAKCPYAYARRLRHIADTC